MLNLSSCDITGEGLAHLKALPHLNDLNLSYCNRLTESALAPIKALSHLTYLDFAGDDQNQTRVDSAPGTAAG
jgi:hypothetical protein